MSESRSIRVRISGRVQGVGFRAWTQSEATCLGLSGWVRNLPGGDVEAVFTGPRAAVDIMLALCRHGPQYAAVDRVEEIGPAAPATGRFEIRRSYPL